jgi:hypothetical protein
MECNACRNQYLDKTMGLRLFSPDYSVFWRLVALVFLLLAERDTE